jgi:alpha-ketoglutarate-dependent taurine dioxygenase
MNAVTEAAARPAFAVTPVKPHIGAEITGIDLTQPVDEATR